MYAEYVNYSNYLISSAPDILTGDISAKYSIVECNHGISELINGESTTDNCFSILVLCRKYFGSMYYSRVALYSIRNL